MGFISTTVLSLLIAVLAALAVHRIWKRGLCDCHDHCGDSPSGGCHGCTGCNAAEHMVADMRKSL